ncbi:hypothetical protein JTE90_018834 [Oedothorax gibbosus]|uniref:Uncharacterized protein n=1 Tax=Oedothorax gibbosus TaxID=931172 RepID=A0AAV6UX73_9ARAC|nr:hypothetical protein JTE90_018834 [Oedothorax gibbosus]
MDALTTRKPYLKGQVTRLTNNVQALGDTTVQIVRLKHYREQATTLVGSVTTLYEELLALVEKTDYETTEQEFHGELNRLDELIISIDGLLTLNAAQPTSSDNHANGSGAAILYQWWMQDLRATAQHSTTHPQRGSRAVIGEFVTRTTCRKPASFVHSPCRR